LACAGIAHLQESAVENVRKLIDASKYSEAQASARQLVADAESRTGADSPETAQALNLLLASLVKSDQFSSPETLAIGRRGVAIRQKLYGPNSSEVAISLNNLGALLARTGHDDESRATLERALAIYERTADRDSNRAADAWSNLALVWTHVGDYKEANNCYSHALSIAEKGPDRLRLAGYLEGQAITQRHMGDYLKAKANYERALAIYEKQFGPDNPSGAGATNNLAQLLVVTGETQRSKLLFQRALAICDKAFGPDSFRAADTLGGLAEAEGNSGEFGASRTLLARAIEIRRKYQGEHPQLASNLSDLALLLSRTGDTDGALKAAVEAETIGRKGLESTVRVLPERQALIYASTRERGLDVILSMVASEANVSRRTAMDLLIRSRALVFDEMAARHRTQHETADSQNSQAVARLTQELSSARVLLSKLAVEGTANVQALADASRQKERAETALAEKSMAFRQELVTRHAGFDQIAAALNSDSVLVSFARYERSPVEAAPSGKIFFADTVPSYLAFVLRGGQAEPTAVTLGPAREIDVLVASLRKQVTSEANAPGQSPKRSEAVYRAAGNALRRKIWDPLVPFMGTATTVFVVPDAVLHLVDLSALPVSRAQYLVEKGPLIHYLLSERDLIPILAATKGQGLLALGDPAYGANQTQLAVNLHAYRGNRSACGGFGSMQFEALPASAREVGEIAAVWEHTKGLGAVHELQRAAASEAAFKLEAPGKQVLHLAVHGFFLGDCVSMEPKSSEGSAEVIREENPLLLSGLALAGANRRNATGPQEEDGILTAEEVAAMDLTGVEWAVLSACESGVGELKAGEGVFGLRRAFQLAGTRSVIMSLWPVEDGATRRWMMALYRERFLKGRGTAESVRAASLRLLAECRSRHHSTHPFYWAGFVATGDWK
jgi:CHAT domain-containing protein/tetratricopeptide (TPR) repeat protein